MSEKEQKCTKPEHGKIRPEECSPEQIKACHGERPDHPCVPQEKCEKPEALKSKPERCSPEQIRKCHGDDAVHPCEPGQEDN